MSRVLRSVISTARPGDFVGQSRCQKAWRNLRDFAFVVIVKFLAKIMGAIYGPNISADLSRDEDD